MPKKPTVKKVDCDGNSEKSLIALIRSLLKDMFTGVSKALNLFKVELKDHNKETNERFKKIMAALDDLKASVRANTDGQATLTTAVNSAIAALEAGAPGDEELLALKTEVDASTANSATLTAALNAAVNPEPPV